MSSKQTVSVVDFPTVLSCFCFVGGLLYVLRTAGRCQKSLNWFRLEGDLGGGGNGQHVDHALGDACMQSPRMGSHQTGTWQQRRHSCPSGQRRCCPPA